MLVEKFAVILVGGFYCEPPHGDRVRLSPHLSEAFRFAEGTDLLMATCEQLSREGLPTEVKTVTMTLEDY